MSSVNNNKNINGGVREDLLDVMIDTLPHGLFATNYDVPENTPIVALSDIHADIDGLIISLRDCAKVIKKKDIAELLDNELTKSIEEGIIDISYALKCAIFIYNEMLLGKKYDEALSQYMINNSYTSSHNSDIEVIRAGSNDLLLEAFLNLHP